MHYLLKSLNYVFILTLFISCETRVEKGNKLFNEILNSNTSTITTNSAYLKSREIKHHQIEPSFVETFEIIDGELWSWGNYKCCLNDSTTKNLENLKQIGTDTNWRLISAGTGHILILKSDSTLWACGDNYHGVLGNGTITEQKIPIQIGTDKNWVSIATGNYNSMGLKSDGTLWHWGLQETRELKGEISYKEELIPIQKKRNSKWIKIEAHGDQNFAIKSDESLWTWSNNFYKDNEKRIDKTILTRIGNDNKWIDVSSGESHCLGLKSNGTLWAWGKNYHGQLGNGTQIDTAIPTQIGKETTWISISSGSFHSLAIKSDSTLWAWGLNGDGELGDGTTTDRYSPILIKPEIKWKSIKAGCYFNIGLKNDGSMWGWGKNYHGEFGLKADKIQKEPIQIRPNN